MLFEILLICVRLISSTNNQHLNSSTLVLLSTALSQWFKANLILQRSMKILKPHSRHQKIAFYYLISSYLMSLLATRKSKPKASFCLTLKYLALCILLDEIFVSLFSLPKYHSITSLSTSFTDPAECMICFGGVACKRLESFCTIKSHLTHKSCMTRWISRSNTCPLCRRPLDIPVTQGAKLPATFAEAYDLLFDKLLLTRSSITMGFLIAVIVCSRARLLLRSGSEH